MFGLDDLRDRTINHYAGKIQKYLQRKIIFAYLDFLLNPGNNPKHRKIHEERIQWFEVMARTFKNAANMPDYGKKQCVDDVSNQNRTFNQLAKL